MGWRCQAHTYEGGTLSQAVLLHGVSQQEPVMGKHAGYVALRSRSTQCMSAAVPLGWVSSSTAVAKVRWPLPMPSSPLDALSLHQHSVTVELAGRMPLKDHTSTAFRGAVQLWQVSLKQQGRP